MPHYFLCFLRKGKTNWMSFFVITNFMSQVLSAVLNLTCTEPEISFKTNHNYCLITQHTIFWNRANARDKRWHYYLKAYWDTENITGPTILKPTFVTALFSLSCGCGVDGIFCTPHGGAWSPPPQIREILPAVVTLHVCVCIVCVCVRHAGPV